MDALHGAPKLAWRTDAAGKDSLGNPVARVVLTDAATGKQIDAWDSIETATGDGKSLYSGTVPLQTTPVRVDVPAEGRDARQHLHGRRRRTRPTAASSTICWSRRARGASSPTPTTTGAPAATSDRASAAVDAQYGTDTTWDYYKNVHGRNGIGGDGKGSYNRVHYGNDYNNAFWDDSCFCMTYGDGDGTTLRAAGRRSTWPGTRCRTA